MTPLRTTNESAEPADPLDSALDAIENALNALDPEADADDVALALWEPGRGLANAARGLT